MSTQTFAYKARKPGGAMTSGVVAAQTESEAVGELRRQGLTVIALSAKRGGEKGTFLSMSLSVGRSEPRKGKVSVKDQDMVVFTRQLSTMIGAGIPLVEAIEILAEQTGHPGFRMSLDDVASEVRAGKDLSQAMAAHPRLFPKIYINMIRAGEASGQLDTVLERLADYQEAAAALKSEIRSAMSYPVISLVLVLGITFFLLIGIIPKFEEMFASMNIELPVVTRVLLSTSRFLKENILLWSTLLAALVAVAAWWVRTERGVLFIDWLLLKIPVFGPLISKVAISRFARTFATLIQSGVPILGALEIVSETCGNRIVARAIAQASENVRQGETLGEPLASSGVFPLMVTRMISVGEKTGALETLLEKVADFYDQQVKTTVESLTSLIEPLMIAVMGVLVGGMVMAIFFPIFKMVGSLAN